MTQTMDLNQMGLMPLNDVEIRDVDGGKTDFAYDLGTFFRAMWNFNPGAPHRNGEYFTIIGKWYVQQ